MPFFVLDKRKQKGLTSKDIPGNVVSNQDVSYVSIIA